MEDMSAPLFCRAHVEESILHAVGMAMISMAGQFVLALLDDVQPGGGGHEVDDGLGREPGHSG
jgi:hypothetical protein